MCDDDDNGYTLYNLPYFGFYFFFLKRRIRKNNANDLRKARGISP